MIQALLIAISIFVGSTTEAKTVYETVPTPIKGGTYYDSLSSNPLTLNPILEESLDDRKVISFTTMSLYDRDPDSYEFFPSLAEKEEVSKDKKTYTYTLNSKAKWSDGTPVTSDDFVFSFEKIMDPKVEAAALRSFLGGVKIEKIDARKFKFIVENPRFNTRDFLKTSIIPVQKKQFDGESDFNKSAKNLRLVVCGPYKLKSISRDQQVELEFVSDWWAKDLPSYKNRFNFKNIVLRIIPDGTLRYERWLRGDIDGITFRPDQFALQVRDKDKDKIGAGPDSKQNVWANNFPVKGSMGWYGVAWNLTHPILQSLKVRQAIAYSVDYKAIVDRAFFGLVKQALGPFGSSSDNTDAGLKAGKGTFTNDQKKASALLKADGWADTDGDNVLDKVIAGKKTPLKINVKFFTDNVAAKQSLQMIKENLKKIGVELELKATEGSALYSDFDDRKYEGLFIGWGGGSIYPDPKQNWHSDSAKEKGSNNTSFKNPEVDQLIEAANKEFDMKKRAKHLQKIGKILYTEQPYLFLMERFQVLMGENSRVKSPRWVFKYSYEPSSDMYYKKAD